MSLLQADRLNSYYGDSHILFDVSLRIEKNEVVALLGRNGAGKSTTLKTLMGVIKPRTGTIMLDGKPTQDLPPHVIAALGVQLVPEDRRVFGSLNVEENLVLARLTTKNGWPIDRIWEMFPRLKERRRSRGTDLSGGEQQMLGDRSRAHPRPQAHLARRAVRGPRPGHREGFAERVPDARGGGADDHYRRAEHHGGGQSG